MIIKIFCVAITTVITASIIKQYKPDIALIVSVCGGLVVVFLCLESFSELIDGFVQVSSQASISNQIVKPIIKVIGIGYLTEFCSNMAEDVGNKTMQSKILLGGKIAICTVALPIIVNMLTSIISLI